MLIFLCGKMGAGKSTHSSKIAQEKNAILISEDIWLETLYPNKVRSIEDYIKYSKLLKPLVKALVQNMLSAGMSVVMDFPANTIAQRDWFKSIYSEVDVDHELIYLNVSNEICLQQIAKRRKDEPERSVTDTEEMFCTITKFFVEPSAQEGFNLRIIQRY